MAVAMQYGSGGEASRLAGIGGGLKLELVWTNPNPDSSFSAQTVPMDLAGYSMVLILFRDFATNDAYGIVGTIARVGDYTALMFTAGGSNRTGRRRANVQTTGIAFEAGQYNATTHNEDGVPQAVYGIR